MCNLVILAFEGPDKSGKSSLINSINSVTNYKYLCIDRFTGSAWVYDNLSQRRDRNDQLIKFEKQISELEFGIFINIFLICDEEILIQRIKKFDEFAEVRLKRLSEMIKLYDYYREQVCQIKSIVINTSYKSINECSSEIIRRVEDLCQRLSIS